jgi:hypothetical protein
MAKPSAPASDPENTDTRFKPGQSGNPAGKPRGARNQATQALDDLARGSVSEIIKRLIKDAKAGNTTAAQLILSRVWIPPKGRRVSFALPAIHTSADTLRALSSVLTAVADGVLSSEEAKDLAAVLDAFRSAHQAIELEQRIQKLEALQDPDAQQ